MSSSPSLIPRAMHRFRTASSVLWLLVASIASGCGDGSISGGTRGSVSTGGQPLAEVEIRFYRVEKGEPRPVGFAVTAADGSFELVSNEARGALQLEPGEYRCTVESAGAPVEIPKEYWRPESTPLSKNWSGSGSLDFEITGVRPQ